MKKGIILVLLVFIVSLVGVSGVELVTSNREGYSFKVYADNWRFDKHTESLRYTDSNNVTFDVAIVSSENSEDIDNLFYDRISNSQNTLNFGEHTVYVFRDGKYLFWRSGNSLIQIHSEPNKLNEFPTELINEYLKLNPPTCEGKDCYESVVLMPEGEFTFKTFRELEPKIRDYTQNYLPCPSRNPSKEDIQFKINELLSDQDRFSESEINNMVIECKQEGAEAFTVKLKDKTAFMDECENGIKLKLSEKNIANYKEFDIISECTIQEDFKERYSDEINNPDNQLFFENLFEKRISSIVNEIENKESTHERTEEDDEELYQQRLDQQRKRDDPSTFNSSANYTLETFPEYSGESTENFLERFWNYFKKAFNIFDWQKMQEEKKNKGLGIE